MGDAVLRYVMGFKANITIVFLGAFAVMALIKLTTYLPGKYYFSFSKLFAGASEPFIVDPPSVTGAKLCALMSRYNLTSSDIGREVNCSAKLGGGSSVYSYGAALFEKSEIDRIYTLALTVDRDLRAHLAAAEAQLKPQALADADVQGVIATSGSVNQAFRNIWNKYELQLGRQIPQIILPQAEATFASVRTKEIPQSSRREGARGPLLKGLSPVEAAAVRDAHAAFVKSLAEFRLGGTVEALTKSTVDEIIGKAYSQESIARGVAQHYRESITERAKGLLRAHFAEVGAAPLEKEAAKRLIFTELVKDGLNNYIVATVIRLLPVLFIGLALGFVFGRDELFSASIAGAFAAFLLTWPIMLMWDTVVQSTWHDKKLIFIAFYVVYIISFFLTARVGAMIGVRIREGAPEQLTRSIDEETRHVPIKGVSWGELAVNVVLGLLANGAVAAWNVVIPLNA